MVAENRFLHENRDFEQGQMEETEDTLSLCDLPIYGEFKCDEWTDDRLSGETPDLEFFEFSSQDFSLSRSFPSDNIIFCGKVIPCKKKTMLCSERSNKPRRQRGRLSRWMSVLFRWGVSSNKSRWYLFMFGLSRFPMKMELGDMKTRQSRLKGKSPASVLSSNCNWDFQKKSHGSGLGAKASFIGCIPLLPNS